MFQNSYEFKKKILPIWKLVSATLKVNKKLQISLIINFLIFLNSYFETNEKLQIFAFNEFDDFSKSMRILNKFQDFENLFSKF